MCEYYTIKNVSFGLDSKGYASITRNGEEIANTGFNYQAGYKAFAKACKRSRIAEWDIERFWGWAELGGGCGTPEDNGCGRRNA